jgi:hypothetical protein
MLLLPFAQGGLAERCRREGAVESEEYTEEGLKMTVILGGKTLREAEPYII